MKFKYFLRGVGTGIIFTSIILFVAYKQDVSTTFTDEEIIKMAKDLGMVEQEDRIGDLLTTEKQNKEETSTNETSEDNAITEENTQMETTQNITTEDTSLATTEILTTEEIEATTEDSKGEIVIITIEGGSTSYPVCEKIERAGLVDSAQELDNYLIEHGYASRIRVGEHELKKGMTFKEIAEAISDPV